ncbi:kiwellin-like [Rhodamnia argentea]|uniref:Kiwellin-like n=1 Tax=Rhodamnia argentea TaxID=178133 RepID=A0ABM3HJF5_9MYRT|nr:kiwellin-like [Rhodamnia argentea]
MRLCMKYFVALLLALALVISITLFPSLSDAISSCSGPCRTLDDCTGQLICINGKCHDDPDVGTHSSPPVISSTRATLTNNDFSDGGDGGGPSKCDERHHKNSELIVALSTGWYADGSRCGNRIKITSMKTRRSVIAKVVDECDSRNGCDGEHADQPPCRNNIVDGSNAVWHAMGLDIEVGEEDVTWSMA